MLFNSIEFILFLVLVFGLYWFIPFRKLKYQNLLLLCVSYVFYAWWDWRFLILMFLSSLVDFLIGKKMDHIEKHRQRKVLLWTSVIFNIGLLSFFKYFNFFVDSFIAAFSSVGIELESTTLNIILPIGISFYTFQTLSYTIDIYRRHIRATNDIIAYFAFVSFFPQLVAGPIERAKNLLPQFTSRRTFDYQFARDGALQIMWGLFKKVAVADVIGARVDIIYSNYESMPSSSIWMGVILFGLQGYADFSAYADISIGVGKLFGFRIMKNFNYPFFSLNFADFWRRWHISLSFWFRDYVYLPLGGSRGNSFTQFRNIMIVFFLSGLWHGANDWNFVTMGVSHGFIVWLTVIWLKREKEQKPLTTMQWQLPTFNQLLKMTLVFFSFSIPLVFFRAPNMDVASSFLSSLFSEGLFLKPIGTDALLIGMALLAVEWFNRDFEHPFHLGKWPPILRWTLYYTIIIAILYYNRGETPYIYFQF
jgi:alginate O-acetyltransferase complex protein AlgI